MTTFGEVLDGSSVLICAGPGGVGKTTTAAAIALDAARRGRRACVVTIDPARRLADALGVEELTNEPHQVDADWDGTGELWALMLDTKGTFDSLVRRYAANDEQAEIILANRFYRNISGALSGTQEYMAVEKLYELHDSGRFDLVVVDTPPTRHALDFLDAPRRLTRFLDNRIFRMLMMPTRAGLRAVNVATQLFLRTVSKVIGGEVVGEAVAFFTAFEGMEHGFRDRADRVETLLAAPGTRFVVVASPRRAAVAEAAYFAERLGEIPAPVSALVLNRMSPTWSREAAEAPHSVGGAAPGAGAGTDGPIAGGWAALTANLADMTAAAAGEEANVAELTRRAPGATVVRVPLLADEVHDLAGLARIGAHLLAEPAG